MITKENKAIGDAVMKGIKRFEKTGKAQGKGASDIGMFENLQKDVKQPTTKPKKLANKKQP